MFFHNILQLKLTILTEKYGFSFHSPWFIVVYSLHTVKYIKINIFHKVNIVGVTGTSSIAGKFMVKSSIASTTS